MTVICAEEPRNPYQERIARSERQKRLQDQLAENEQQLQGGDIDSADGRPLLVKAIEQFNRYQSVKVQLRQKVNLFGHELVGKGQYLQVGQNENRKVRMELRIQAADQVTSLIQVCDGRNLYIHQDLLGDISLSKVDVRAVRLRLDQDQQRLTLLPASAWSAFGGLPRLLANLEASFRFGKAREEDLDDVAVWVLDGLWKPERLATFLPEQAASILAGERADLSKLLPQIPHRVVLSLGRDDWFPYRIEYQRRVRTDRKGERPAYTIEPLMIFEGYDVKFDRPIGDEEFEFSPGEQECVDKTQEYLQELLTSVPAPPAK